jgi:hypothetical protein
MGQSTIHSQPSKLRKFDMFNYIAIVFLSRQRRLEGPQRTLKRLAAYLEGLCGVDAGSESTARGMRASCRFQFRRPTPRHPRAISREYQSPACASSRSCIEQSVKPMLHVMMQIYNKKVAKVTDCRTFMISLRCPAAVEPTTDFWCEYLRKKAHG